MEINAQFDRPVQVRSAQLDWIPSPMKGVERRMLDRVGGELARATSIVRYAEGSAFPEHTHSGGEEFIVLEGVFQDEHGDYPAGTYVRNPVGTHHIPRSDSGCTIFVKLWQFDPDDQEQFAVDLNTLALTKERAGVHSALLAHRSYERVTLEQWDADCVVDLADHGGFEILVLSGELAHGGETYAAHDWLRWPANTHATFSPGFAGARLWIKRGHLSDIRIPAQL